MPLCVPTEDEYIQEFDDKIDYARFLRKENLKKPDDNINRLIPHAFRMPYSSDEFEVKQYSGDYEVLAQIYNPGQLVTELPWGPIMKRARLNKISIDGSANIEYAKFDERNNEIKTVSKPVSQDEINANQLAGPNLFIDNKIAIPKSIENAEYDLDHNCLVAEEDVEALMDAISIKSNTCYINKLKHFRQNPSVYIPPKREKPTGKYITGDLKVTIVSARNLSTKNGDGDVFVEIKSYEHNYEEEQFGNFALDESFQNYRDSQRRMTQAVNVTESRPIDKNVIFNQEKNLGKFVKGASYDLTFIVKQETNSGDEVLGVTSIKSDEYLDPFRPAKECYLLLHDPPYFVSSLYLNVLFIPSENTLNRMNMRRPVPDDFNTAYDEWILSRTIYVDKYGFTVPLGKYHPNLIKDNLWKTVQDEDSEDEYKYNEDDDMQARMNRKRTPEKRIKNAVNVLPALKEYNQELKRSERNRPDYEEILFHFRQLQMYANNEAKVQANETRQEYWWDNYVSMVTENLHDESAEQGDDANDGHMFNISRRSKWNNNSWQNSDIWALCRLGISHNLRSRIWYDLLEVESHKEDTSELLAEDEDYDEYLSAYENMKVMTNKYMNISFAQIDEDMRILDTSNTPSRDEKGKIKNILKWFVVWQHITQQSLWYSINFGFIIQRLLSIFTEDNAFWVFCAIMSKMKDRIGVDESIMLDRKGMFRMLSACLCSHTKETYPEIHNKCTHVGFSLDFFLYDKMSSLFSNCFASDTLLRLWDLIFLEFSSPTSGDKNKGLGYIISTCLYLINSNREQILLAKTPEQLETALDNSRSVVFNTEEIIEEIYNINTKNFVAGNWFSRRLASVSKVFGDAASYLDNARISLEEDYDLIFEKTMRENRVVWNMLYSDDEDKADLDYIVWNEEENSILSRFKQLFGQEPSREHNLNNRNVIKNGDLKFSTIYIFVYNCFDVQNIGKPSIGK